MCRLLGIVSDEPTRIADVLGTDLRLFTGLSQERHGDGWGMVWDDGERLETVKSITPAFQSSRFEERVSEQYTTAALVHLRWATMGLAVTQDNTHPFSRSGVAFAHNGSIHDIDSLTDLVAPDLLASVTGATDSERYFLAVLSRMRDMSATEAMVETLQAIEHVSVYSALNAILLTPEQLIVAAMFDPTRTDGEPEEYYQLRYATSSSTVVVASSGWPQPGWTLIPNRSVLAVDRRTLAATVVSVDASHQVAPALASDASETPART